MKENGTIHLTIDGKAVEVARGTTVYQAAETLGINIPIFCYHDRMPPFGACRMCLVEVEKMPKLQASCTLEAADGMIVSTGSNKAVEGREGIVELLLINHPLDCPICDRGGECPLQENALHHGPGKSRFFEKKRRFKKPLPLGPVLMLDRERCIVCARCTRFSDLISGDHALEFIDRGYRTEVGTPNGGPAESKFIGNTIMICPVGALTSQVYRFRARPWDNDSQKTSCALCPVGCSLMIDSRDGEIMRTRSSADQNVNDIWLCDKGWFGYEFSSHPDRLKTPLIRKDGKLEESSWEEALQLIARKVQQAKPRNKIGAIGGNSLTTEENYLYQKLFREGAETSHLDHRVGMPLFQLGEEGMQPGMESSFGECEKLSFAYLFGLDVTEEFPVLWLRLKQAMNHGAEISFIGHYAPEIASHLKSNLLHPPGEEIETLRKVLVDVEKNAESGNMGALFIGSQYLNTLKRKEILSFLKEWRKSAPNVKINIMEGSGNSFGARFAGMHPEHSQTSGMDILQILEQASSNGWDFLFAAGANFVQKYPEKLIKGALRNLGFLVVQDLFLNESAEFADVVLPALSFLEKEGSIHNIEGRKRKLKAGKSVPPHILSDKEIFLKLGDLLGVGLDFDEKFLEALEKERLSLPDVQQTESLPLGPRATNSSGSLVATFSEKLFDNGVRMGHNPKLLQLAKEPEVRVHPADAAKIGILQGAHATLRANGEAISCKVKVDSGVAAGVVVLPKGMKKLRVQELGGNLLNGLTVEIVRS